MSGLREIFQECGDFTWSVFDCEELVWVAHRRRSLVFGQNLQII